MDGGMDADLYAAATAGDIHGILRLREKIDQVTETNETILHLAALSNKAACVETILDEFPTLLDKVNFRNETALHLAAAKGYAKVAEVLISKSVSIDSDGIMNRSSVDFIRMGNVDLDTALHLATRNNDSYTVLAILKSDPYCLYAKNRCQYSQNRNFESPLYLAAIGGDSYIVSKILLYCQDTNMEGPEGRTALHAAVIAGCCDPNYFSGVIQCIMQHRPTLYQRADDKGWTVFHYAASLNFNVTIRSLIDCIMYEERAEISKAMAKASTNHKTAHHIAAYEGHIDVLITLIEYCPDACEAVDEDGRNILHMAAEQSHKKLIQYLLYSYFLNDIAKLLNIKDKNGNTPLHLLVISGCFVPELIKHEGVDTTLKNNDDFTPEDLLYLEEDIIGDQASIRKALLDIQVNHPWKLWRKFTNSGWNKQLNLWLKKMKSGWRSGHESFVQENNKRRRKDAKFKIANTKIMKEEVELYRAWTNTPIIVSTGFNIVSVVVAMMLTFIMGTFVGLSLSGFAVALLVISCLLFLLVFVLLIKWKFDPKEKFKL